MNILVYPERAIVNYECNSPHAVISIRSPGRPQVVLPKNKQRKEVLWLEFHDLDDRHIDSGIQNLFDEHHARQVKEFYERHKELKGILVNCEAGISRSAGVAAALSKVANGKDKSYFSVYIPNRRVYRMVLEAFFGPLVAKESIAPYEGADSGSIPGEDILFLDAKAERILRGIF